MSEFKQYDKVIWTDKIDNVEYAGEVIRSEPSGLSPSLIGVLVRFDPPIDEGTYDEIKIGLCWPSELRHEED